MALKLFLVVWFALAAQRLAELARSRRNERIMQARGGYEAYPGHFQLMRLMHVAWFAAMLLEAPVSRPEPRVVALGLLCLVLGQGLRVWAIRSLGERWSVRIMVCPGAPLVATGAYRLLRHPNYLGVALELFGAPLLHGCWRTAVFFTAANAALLRYRIRCEERALGLR